MACQITYKNKKYGYEDFISLLANGEFKSLVDNGSIDTTKLKGEISDALQIGKAEKIFQREPQETGKTGGKRGGVERIKQGKETAKESEEEVKFSLSDTIAVDGVQRPTTNSLGKPIANTEEKVRNFWKWFGDSQTVDENGRPILGYHGTKSDFDVFKGDIKYKDAMIYLSDNPEFAQNWIEREIDSYHSNRTKEEIAVAKKEYDEEYEKINKETDWERLNKKWDKKGEWTEADDQYEKQYEARRRLMFQRKINAYSSVMPVYMRVQKLFDPRIDEHFNLVRPLLEKRFQQPADSLVKKSGKRSNYMFYEDYDIVTILKSEGFDAMFISEKSDGDPHTFAIFSPEQIKSATGNIGEFSPETADIRFSLADELKPINDSLDELSKYGVLTQEERKTILKNVKESVKDVTGEGLPTKSKLRFAFLSELIKARRIGQKMSNDAFKALGKEITRLLKEELTAKERRFITNGQFRSIINRLSKATTQKAQQKVIDYVYDTVILGNGAKYKSALNDAENAIKIIGKAIDAGTFTTSRQQADRVVAIELDELSYEELKEFIRIANKINAKSKIPNVHNLLILDELFSDRQKVVEEKEIDSIDSAIKLFDYVSKLANSLKPKEDEEIDEEIEEETNQPVIHDIQTYLSMLRKIALIKKRSSELLAEIENQNEAETQQSNLDQILEQISLAINDQVAEFESQLEAFKEAFANSVYSKLKQQETKDSVDLFETEEEKEKVRDFLSLTLEDIQNLPLNLFKDLNVAIDNLKIGEWVKGMSEIMDEVVETRLMNENYIPIAEKVFQDEHKEYTRIMKSQGLGIAQRIFTPKSWRKVPETNLTNNLKRLQWFRWNLFLGITGLRFHIGKIAQEAGIGINKADIDENNFLKDFVPKYDAFAKGRSGKEQTTMLKRLFIFLAEQRWQGAKELSEDFKKKVEDNPSFFHQVFIDKKSMPQERTKVSDPKEFDENRQEYIDFMDFMRGKGATKITKNKNGEEVEVLDIEKADSILREDNSISSFMDAVDGIWKQYKGMNKVVAANNGKNLVFGKYYIPIMRKHKNDDIDNQQNMESWLKRGLMNAKLLPSSINEWTGVAMYPEMDLLKVIMSYTEMIRRGYFVLPRLKRNAIALRRAFSKVAQKGIKDKEILSDHDITLLSRSVIETTRSGLANYYNMKVDEGIHSIIRKIETSVKKPMVAHPVKAVSEFIGSNMPRLVITLGKIPINSWSEYSAENDFWQPFISSYLSKQLWSVYSPEINKTILNKKFNVGKIKRVMKSGEQSADWLVRTPDKQAGIPLFIDSFRSMFKEITGNEFSIREYQSNENYRIKNRVAIEQSASFADTRVEELLNSKNPMSNPERTSFFSGLITAKRDSYFVIPFNLLMSFGKNDSNQIADSVKRAMWGGTREKIMAYRDILSIITSNFMYGLIRLKLGLLFNEFVARPAVEIVAGMFAGSTGGGDDTDKKYFDEKNKQFKSGKFYYNYTTNKIAMDLILGGSSNIFEYFGKMAVYMFEKSGGMTDEQKEFINTYFQSRNIQKVPLYGNYETYIKVAFPPIISTVALDALNFAQSAKDFSYGYIYYNLISSIWDAERNGKLDKKDAYDMINLINISLKYTFFFPFVPYIERGIKYDLDAMRKIETKEKNKEVKKSNQPVIIKRFYP